jgi:hypothetical protein
MYKIFDQVYVMLGPIKFPAAIWGISHEMLGNEKLYDVLVAINGVCIPRTFPESKIIDARADSSFSWSTVSQLQNAPTTSRGPQEGLYPLL